MNISLKRTLEQVELVKLMGSNNRAKAIEAQETFAAAIAGSSFLHSGHHVAQNSITIGFLPIMLARSTGAPVSDGSVSAGAVAPTAMPPT